MKSFVMKSGERYRLLIDATSGQPLYHPNLFVTTQIRNNALSVSAMETVLAALCVLLTFCDERGINLETRLLSRQFLAVHELDALSDFCQLCAPEQIDPSPKPILISLTQKPTPRKRVASATEYTRLSYISKYLKWLAEILFSGTLDRKTSLDISRMQRQLEARRPLRKGRNRLSREKGLDEQQLETLFEVVRPGSQFNPFKEFDIQARNRLAILMLLFLGIRGSELLNIRSADIDWSCNQIVIARRPDEKDDPRVDQPLLKTLDRRVPARDTLIEDIRQYITKYRRMVPHSLRHDYLLVTHKSGPTQGQPMSISAYQKMMAAISRSLPELAQLHGHALRHSWNRRFSEFMDKMDKPPSPEQQEKIRSYLQGWKEGSGTGATYNRRFTEAKAMESGLKLQEATLRIPENLTNDC